MPPPRPSRVSFERKLEDCTLTAAAAPVRLPLLRQERRNDLRLVDPSVPAQADPSERSTGKPFVNRADGDEKTPGANDDAEEAGPWVLGPSGLRLFDPSLSDGKKKIGDGKDAEAELRLEWRSGNFFLDLTESDDKKKKMTCLVDEKKKIRDGEDAEAELRLEGRTGDPFFDRTGSDEETRSVDGDAEAGQSVLGRSDLHLFDGTESHDKETTGGGVDDAGLQALERRSLSDGRRSTVGDDGDILDDA